MSFVDLKRYNPDILFQASRISKKRSTLLKGSSVCKETYLVEIDVDRFCPKKIFDVIFLAAVDDETEKITQKICETAKEYEDLSALTVIHRDDILGLVDVFEHVEMPLCLKEATDEACLSIRVQLEASEPLTSLQTAQLTKLKLVNVMYRHYLKELDKMDKRRILEEELDNLTRMGAKRPPKPKELPKQSKVSLSGRSISCSQMLRPVETENGIIFDDDVFNHVWFYVFHGIYDADVLLHLTRHFRVNVRAIIKMNNIDGTLDGQYAQFWDKINDYMDGPHRKDCFENTIMMNYTPRKEESFVEMFKGLSYIIKNISEIKLKHLNYIRHMDIQRRSDELPMVPFSCFTTYKLCLNKVPTELANHWLILGGLLKEVSTRFESPFDEESITVESSSSERECSNPCSTSTIFKTPTLSQTESLKKFNTFLAHENDLINIIAKSYNKSGLKVCEMLPKLLRETKAVHTLREMDYESVDMIHKHDIDPSSKADSVSDSLLHLMYLYLFSTFEDKQKEDDIHVEEDNIEVYDRKLFRKSCQIKISGEGENNKTNHVNLYDSFVMDFAWKEDLPPSIMLQKLAKAEEEYSYMDQKYCQETDKLLIRCSDRLDNFGTNVEMHEVSILTPVCLRDFCRYVTVERSSWLKQNNPRKYVRKLEEREKCPGVKEIIKRDIFQEYRHLLDAQIKLESDMNIERVEEDNTVTFGELLDELAAYPTSTNLVDECSKIEPKFPGYDLSNRYLAIRGATTTFASHDNVKITVDNTRLTHEEKKCSVVLDFDKNSLVFHSNKIFMDQDYTFHANVEDGSTVTLILHDRKQKKSQAVDAHSHHIEIRSSVAEESEKVAALPDDMEGVKNVISIDEEGFDEKAIPMDDTAHILDHLKETIAAGEDIYKVNKELRYLTRSKPVIEVPFCTILRRILHRGIQKDHPAALFKKFDSRSGKTDSRSHSKVDFRICKPNGLYISSYPSKVRDNFIEIKQEFLESSRGNGSVKNEEFRLFTREGYVLIKKTDGCISLLKSSGVEIRYEYPDSKNEDVKQSNLKFCHCKTINDYRRKLNRLFKDENQKTYISRRAHLRTKRGYIINEDIMNIFRVNKPPYLKTTSIKFDGQRISLKGNKITEKQLYYTTIQQDFAAQEIYFERTDGFQSLFDKFGTQTVRFMDGTRISSSIQVSKKLVDGYVYVSLSFKYEHPLYCTVLYKFDNSCEIQVNKQVTLRIIDADSLKMNINPDASLDVKADLVNFTKSCPQCSLSYICNFNTLPFSLNDLNYDEVFVSVKDTYDKHFQVDFAGNCQRNSDYIDGPLNRAKCNHYRQNDYKKLFVLNRDFSGEYFWSDTKVQNRKKSNVGWTNAEKVYKVRGRDMKIVTFKRKMFEDYSKRFVNSNVLYDSLGLSRNKGKQTSDVYYTTFRSLKEMLTITDTNLYLQCLVKSLEERGIQNQVNEKVKDLLAMRDSIDTTLTASVKLSEDKLKTVDEERCKCTKKRLTMAEKMARWKKEYQKQKNILRKNYIPPYFKSQFCKINNKVNKT